MKILTISYRRDAFATLPPEEQRRLNVSAVEAILKVKKAKGDKYVMYSAPGWNRMISVGEYDSIEEYYRTLQTEASQRGFSNLECYPLIEMDQAQMEAYLKQA